MPAAVIVRFEVAAINILYSLRRSNFERNNIIPSALPAIYQYALGPPIYILVGH